MQRRYGTSPDSLAGVVTGSTTTYTAADMCDQPANTTSQVYFRSPGFLHAATLTGLAPRTVYYYQFGNDRDGWSATYQFTSRCRAWCVDGSLTASFRVAASTRNVSILAYADMGLGAPPGAQSTAELVDMDVQSGLHDLLLVRDAQCMHPSPAQHFGDISYARGQGCVCGGAGDVDACRWMWEQYFRMIQPYATRIPYAIRCERHVHPPTHTRQHRQPRVRPRGVLRPCDCHHQNDVIVQNGGVHDPSGAGGEGWHPFWGNMGDDSSGGAFACCAVRCARDAECAVPMYYRFTSPSNGNSIFWYSFDYGSVHVVQLSSEHVCCIALPMLAHIITRTGCRAQNSTGARMMPSMEI